MKSSPLPQTVRDAVLGLYRASMDTKIPVWLTGVVLEAGQTCPEDQTDPKLRIVCDQVTGVEQASDSQQQYLVRTARGHIMFVDLTGTNDEMFRPPYVEPIEVHGAQMA
jgi:hypothetical protein